MGWERRRGLGFWVGVGVRWGGWGGDCRPQGGDWDPRGEIVEGSQWLCFWRFRVGTPDPTLLVFIV